MMDSADAASATGNKTGRNAGERKRRRVGGGKEGEGEKGEKTMYLLL